MKALNHVLAISTALLATTQAYSSDWNFYGSARASTFGQTVVDTGTNGKSTNSKSYTLQGNSLFGAKVAQDSTLSGQVEYGLKGVVTNATTNATTTAPVLRLLYGEWKISKSVAFLLGQNWSVINFKKSNQVWNSDNDLQGEGAITELRVPQARLTAYGVKLAFVPSTQAAISVNKTLGFATRPDNLPKAELAYDYPIGPFHVGVAGAYNGYTLDAVNPTIAGATTSPATAGYINAVGKYKKTYDVSNVVSVLDFGFKSKVVSVNASASYIINGNEFGLVTTNPYKAYIDTTGKLVDAKSFIAYAEISAPFEFVTPELGFGIEAHGEDFYGKLASDTRVTMYLQAAISPVKNISFTPEIGLIKESQNAASGKTYDKADLYYYGAKTQIDF